MAEQKLLVKREGDFHYPIYFKNDFQDLAGAIREEGLENRKICIVTDSHVAPLYHEAVKSALQEISSEIFSFVFEAGEKNKNLNTVQELYKTLIFPCLLLRPEKKIKIWIPFLVYIRR